jgi:hypothetical protein
MTLPTKRCPACVEGGEGGEGEGGEFSPSVQEPRRPPRPCCFCAAVKETGAETKRLPGEPPPAWEKQGR